MGNCRKRCLCKAEAGFCIAGPTPGYPTVCNLSDAGVPYGRRLRGPHSGLSHVASFTASAGMLCRQIRLGHLSCRMPADECKVHAPPLSPELPLYRACETYLARRARHLRPRSLEAYAYHFRTLKSFFGPNRLLSSFHEGDFTKVISSTIKGGAAQLILGTGKLDRR